jgi:hypothetical protein
MNKFFVILLLVLTIVSCSKGPGEQISTKISKSAIKEIKVFSTSYDPIAKDNIAGFEVTLENEIRIGDTKTKSFWIPAYYNMGIGRIFVVMANPDKKYTIYDFRVYTRDRKHFYLQEDPIFIELAK